MWRTELGYRILKGAEAKVFADALTDLLDEAIMGRLEDYELGIRCFDDLTFGQRISVLATGHISDGRHWITLGQR
jgi:hypothetical protein